jgi:DNA-binding response OmpR family regulator
MPAAKILLVHYDPRAQDSLRKSLEEEGFEVVTARDGASAMAGFLESDPDLVLLEAMLPKVHGFEVCADLKKTRRGQQVPVAVMSAIYKGRRYRDEAIHTHGANAYLEMPMDGAKLAESLRKLLDQAGETTDAGSGD